MTKQTFLIIAIIVLTIISVVNLIRINRIQEELNIYHDQLYEERTDSNMDE